MKEQNKETCGRRFYRVDMLSNNPPQTAFMVTDRDDDPRALLADCWLEEPPEEGPGDFDEIIAYIHRMEAEGSYVFVEMSENEASMINVLLENTSKLFSSCPVDFVSVICNDPDCDNCRKRKN